MKGFKIKEKYRIKVKKMIGKKIKNRYTILTLAIIFVEILIYLFFGHRFIEAMYKGKAIGIFNRVISGQAEHPLGYYLSIADKAFVFLNIFILLILIYISSTIFLIKSSKMGKEISIFIKDGVPKISNFISGFFDYTKKNLKLIIVCCLIFVTFLTAYLSLSLTIGKTHALDEFNLMFELDPPRVIQDMTSLRAIHYRTKVHPIYVLLVNPIGCLLKSLLPGDFTAALVINSIFGSIGVFLAFIFFNQFNKNTYLSILFTLIFAFSMSQLFFSIVPDTMSFAVCSLLLTYVLFKLSLDNKRYYFIWWIIAGVLTMGITITNFVQTIICYSIIAFLLSSKIKTALVKMYIFILSVVFSMGILALIQKIIYPPTNLFFNLNKYGSEARYFTFLVLKQPLETFLQLFKHFFLVNIIAPHPFVYESYPNVINNAITFSKSWNYSLIGWIGLFIWLIILTLGTTQIYRNNTRHFYIGAILCLLFNALMHSFYGLNKLGEFELFTYSGNFTFLVLTFICSYFYLEKKIFKVIISLFALILCINNLNVIRDIISIYK